MGSGKKNEHFGELTLDCSSNSYLTDCLKNEQVAG
jgi:hypothetical protein